jgi:hypothetical protein
MYARFRGFDRGPFADATPAKFVRRLQDRGMAGAGSVKNAHIAPSRAVMVISPTQ